MIDTTEYEQALIQKTEVNSGYLVITLANGVTIHLSSNPGSIHLSFSGIEFSPTEGGLVATPNAYSPEMPQLKLANYVEIKYAPKKRG